MRIVQSASCIFVGNPFYWRTDWAWGLPLIVLTVLIHVSGLGLISQRVVHGNAGRRIAQLNRYERAQKVEAAFF